MIIITLYKRKPRLITFDSRINHHLIVHVHAPSAWNWTQTTPESKHRVFKFWWVARTNKSI